MRRLLVRNILYVALLGLLFSFPGAVAHAETETPAVPEKGWSLSEDGVLTVTTDGGLRVYKDDDLSARAHHLPQADCRAIVFAEGVTRIDLTECWTSEYMDIPSTVREILPLEGMLSALAVGEFRVSADNPYYYVENGMLIDRAAQTVLAAEYGLTDAVVPDGIVEISCGVFSHHDLLRTVMIPEGVLYLEEFVFDGCKNLVSVKLPRSLRAVCRYAFSDCTSLETLVLPPNLRVCLEADSGDAYVFYCSGLKTMVFTDSHTSVWIDTESPIERVAFLNRPPTGSIYWDHQTKTPDTVVLYRKAYEKYWRPHGETKWEGVKLRAMTEAEEREIKLLAGDLWDAEWTDDAAGAQGWEYDTGDTLTVYSDAGLANFMRIAKRSYAKDVILREGVTHLAGRFHQPVWSRLGTLYISSTVVRLESDAFFNFRQVLLNPDNPYFFIENGRLIEKATGLDIGYGDASYQMYLYDPATPLPKETPAGGATPMPRPTITPEPSQTPWSRPTPTPFSTSTAFAAVTADPPGTPVPDLETALTPDSGAAPESQEAGKPDPSFRLGAVGIVLLVLIAAVALGVVTWRGKRE